MKIDSTKEYFYGNSEFQRKTGQCAVIVLKIKSGKIHDGYKASEV